MGLGSDKDVDSIEHQKDQTISACRSVLCDLQQRIAKLEGERDRQNKFITHLLNQMADFIKVGRTIVVVDTPDSGEGEKE